VVGNPAILELLIDLDQFSRPGEGVTVSAPLGAQGLESIPGSQVALSIEVRGTTAPALPFFVEVVGGPG
jgi:hypothetical protein